MIYPIFCYGHAILKEKTKPISTDYPNLEQVIINMFETMYHANGVGLAAPQVGLGIQIFIVDGAPLEDKQSDPKLKDFKKVFINPQILEEKGEKWGYEEGCLSIPGLRDTVYRHSVVQLKYTDEHFQEHIEEFDGLRARIIQHEYDHLQGILFTDHLSAFRKTLHKGKLRRIQNGQIEADYLLKFK